MRKNFKSVIALVLSIMVMMVSLVPAMAESLVDTTYRGNYQTADLIADESVTVKGLDSGDKATFVQIIEWTGDTNGWQYTDAFKTAATAASIALPDIKAILGLNDGNNDGNKDDAQLTAAVAGTLGQIVTKMLSTMTAVQKEAITVTASEYETGKYGATYSKPAATDKMAFVGLYCAMIAPGTVDYNYNPVFIGADWIQSASSQNEVETLLNTKSYIPAALAKKNKVDVDKQADGDDDNSTFDENADWDHDVGDVIDFKVTSQIPAFSTSYQEPQYVITDVMTNGLNLVDYDKTGKGLIVKINNTTVAIGTDYTVEATATGYTLTVTETKLRALAEDPGVAVPIEITYKGKIVNLNEAYENVEQAYNTVTVKFSNNPSDKTSYSLLEDKTNHYTFSLDAKLLGFEEYINSELIKIGVDKDGKELTKSKTESNTTQTHALQNATFGLYTNEACTTPYTNDLYPAPTGCVNIVSDAMGLLNIQGLDAGTYYLKELKAPAGYIKSDAVVKIEISTEYDEIPAGDYTNADGVKVHYNAYKYLKSYTVTVNGNAVSTMNAAGDAVLSSTSHVSTNYTFINKSSEIGVSGNMIATSGIQMQDSSTKLKNVQGVELPSTGGIGTTIFYVGGSLMVLAAAILLITKRRMGSEE